VSHWQDLYARFNEIEKGRREREERAQKAAAERAARDSWAEHATDAVMHAIAEAAAARAEDFAAATGHNVSVDYHGPDPALAGRAPAMTFVRLSYDDVGVLLYSYCTSGELPSLHFVHPQPTAPGSVVHPTFISTFAAVVTPAGEGYALRRPGNGGEHSDRVSVEELVFRAFQLLVEGRSRVPTRLAVHAA
jgi:hypothetical protein